MSDPRGPRDPHAGQGVLIRGAPLREARSAIVALHGRGATAEDIAGLAQVVAPREATILAPRAAGNTWYPFRFLEPTERNEPYLSSALRVIGELIAGIADAGILVDNVALLGFSQGACLALEFAARHARRYDAVIGFSGGLIGPPGTQFDYPGSLEGTPVFLGCSDVDFHIPKERVEETATALSRLGAAVELRFYPGMGHTVNEDEAEAARILLARSQPEESR